MSCPLWSACVTVDEQSASSVEQEAGEGEDSEAAPVKGRPLRGDGISGHAEIAADGGFFQRSASFLQVALMQDGKVLQTVGTDQNGDFRFSGRWPRGSYRIVVREPLYRGSLTFSVRGGEVKGLRLSVQRTEIIP